MTLSRWLLLAAAAWLPAAGAHGGDNAASGVPSPTAGEARPETPALGFRYGRLSARETRALRRGFKLPMDALVGANTTEDLASRAVVAPLPPTDRPFLPVTAPKAGDARNPFEDRLATSFREDPMRALGEMLGASALDDPGDSVAASDDPFASTGLDGRDEAAAQTDSDASAEVSDQQADPFADDPDPFGSEEDDPFAF